MSSLLDRVFQFRIQMSENHQERSRTNEDLIRSTCVPNERVCNPMMPIRLFLVRHGESEANVIRDDNALYAQFRDVPDAEYRLTPTGVEQACKAGVWLAAARTEFAGELVGFVSPFVRAKETAGNLGLGLTWLSYTS